MTFEDFHKRRIEFLAPLDSEERKRLAEHLKSPVLLRALAQALLIKEEIASKLVEADLSNESGVNRAAKLQGEALGAHRAIERLFMAASEEEEDA